MLLLAKVVRLVTMVVVGVIVVGIVLHLLGANAGNTVVSAVYDAAGWLVGPFKNVFSLHGKANYGANWGLAAVVYAIVGGVVSRLLMGAGMGARRRFGRRTGRATPA
jgi:hypothetical protein